MKQDICYIKVNWILMFTLYHQYKQITCSMNTSPPPFFFTTVDITAQGRSKMQVSQAVAHDTYLYRV